MADRQHPAPSYAYDGSAGNMQAPPPHHMMSTNTQQPPHGMMDPRMQQPPPPQQYNDNTHLATASPFNADKATQLLAVCESCFVVVRIVGPDMSFRRALERKCPRCGGAVTVPQEIMEMLILYGHFLPEPVAASILLGAAVLHRSLRADFVASAMNELLIPLQTDYVYDIALPKRREGLEGDLIVGGFVDFEDNTESPSVAARIIRVGDILVAINKKSIVSSSFETNIRMLAHAASPVYLTFRRAQPVQLL